MQSNASSRSEEGTPSVVYAYRPDSLYLNITNRCTNACRFCSVRLNRGRLGPFNLNLAGSPAVPIRVHPARLRLPCPVEDEANLNRALASEPDADTVMEQVTPFLERKESPLREVVFCGCGEPLIRLKTVLAVAEAIKRRDVKVRVNTNGHAALMHGEGVPEALGSAVDSISISLNAHDETTYTWLCRPSAGTEAFEAVLDFSAACVKSIHEVTLSVVAPDRHESAAWTAVPDLAACGDLVDRIGAVFRVR